MMRRDHCCRYLHGLLEKLPLVRHPFDVNRLPSSGIYFFYEKGESQSHNKNKPRIVRVGTHNKNNFRSRISSHYISDSRMVLEYDKPLPKDRSIFRKNIGRAILNKENRRYLKIWDIDFTARDSREKYSHLRDLSLEKRVEERITTLLQDNFSFRFIVLKGEEERKRLERKIIGTLAGCSVCCGSNGWLGRNSPKRKIVESGLWLVQHLKSKGLTPKDMERISQYVDNTRDWIAKNPLEQDGD